MRSPDELSHLARMYAEILREEAQTARVEADPHVAEHMEQMARMCDATADQIEGQLQGASR